MVLPRGLRSDALADERSWPLPTPHLGELAGRGLRLVLTAAGGADPGAMTSVLTGLHPRQHGGRDDGIAGYTGLALPGWLREAGYHVAGVGELGAVAEQFDDARLTAGVDVDEPAADRCWYAAASRARGHAPALAQQRRQRRRSGPLTPDRLLLEPDEDLDGFITQLAEDTLADLPTDRPWALFVGFSGPGNELPPPVGYEAVVNVRGLARGFAPADPASLDAVARPGLPRSVLQRLEPHQVARLRADYLGRVSLIDHGVGRLDAALAARADAGRSWTVVASDRGRMLGEHGLIGGQTGFAPALEVPLVVAGPPAPAGAEPVRAGTADARDAAPPSFPEGLFGTVDVAPTVAALAGADVPPRCPGRSLLGLFNGDELPPGPAANLSEAADRLTVETERFKATFRVTDRVCLNLFDVARDPDERENLVDTPAGKARAAAMMHTLAEALLPLR